MERKKTAKKIYWCIRTAVIWFFFQILACLIPLLVGVGVTMFIGYEVQLEDIFPDILLASFAIGMNLWGIGIGKRPQTPLILKDIHRILVGIVVIGAWGLYMCLFNGGYVANYVKQKATSFDVPYMHLRCVTIILGILILADVVVAAVSSVIEQKNVQVANGN